MDEFFANLKRLHTYISTWVVFAITTFSGWWLQQPLDAQQAAIAQNPWLWWAAPLAGFLSFAIARGLPQFPDSPTFADALKALPTFASTWVAAIASMAAAYWLQMAPDAQHALTQLLPGVTIGGPLAGFVVFAVARGLPQAPKV